MVKFFFLITMVCKSFTYSKKYIKKRSFRVQTENHHMRIPFVLQPEELFMNHVTLRSAVFLVVVTLEEFIYDAM